MGVGTEGGKSGGSGSSGGGSGNGGYGSGVHVNTGGFGSGLSSGGQGNFGGTQGGGVTVTSTGATSGKGQISAPSQGNLTAVVSPSVQMPSAPPVSAPEVPSGGQAPNGSVVIGFPNDGYASGDAQTLDILDLAELLQSAQDNGAPDLYGDVGADYDDDVLTFGERVSATVRNPLVMIAAFGLVGILALKVTMKAA